MLSAIIRGSLRFSRRVAAACVVFIVYGVLMVRGEKLASFPSLAPAQASIETDAPGMVAEQVEQLVTRPIENALIGARGIAAVHSQSIQGLSVIGVDFQAGVDPNRVRQAISESMVQAAGALPSGVGAPRLSPLTSSTDEILKVGFTSDRVTPMALREIVQWTVRPRLLSIPGVANVKVFGGEVRRFEVKARSGDLSDSDLGYADIYNAVRAATSVTGAGFIDTPQQRVAIEPHGQALTKEDIAAGQIQIVGSAPVRISDVADVVEAPAPAFGDAMIMGKPAVVISIVGQFGGNTLDTTRAVERTFATLTPALERQGVTVHGDLDRPANFISTSLRQIAWDLVVGALLITILLILFLRDWRAALISLVSIPLSILATVVVLEALGWTLNTMTLGGMAVALGLIVDDAVIDVENVLRHLRDAEIHHTSRAHGVLMASLEVRAPVIYATLVIAVGLLPVVLMGGVQGAFLRPLAVSIIVASLASVVVAISVTPALALIFLQHIKPTADPPILHRLKTGYDGLLARIGAAPGLVLAGSVLAVVLAVAVFTTFKTQFLPKFHDGHLTAEIDAPAATSMAAMRDFGARISRDLMANPNIAEVSQQIGRADGGVEATGPDHAQFDIVLKRGLASGAQESVERQVQAKIAAYPGLHASVFSSLAVPALRPTENDRMLVRVYGDDLDAIDQTAAKVASVLRSMGGVRGVTAGASPVAPVMRADLNFQRLAIYGLSAADVLNIIQTAFEGRPAAKIYENGRAVDVAVTAEAGLRQDPEGVGDLLLRSSSGVSAPLKTVANVYLTDGRTDIEHDGGLRRQVVYANPSGEVDEFIHRAQAKVAKAVALPPGAYLEFVNLDQGGDARFKVLVNVALAGCGIFAVLLVAFGNVRASAIILISTVFAFFGGVAAVALTGGVLSLGAFIGFITLLGLSTRHAILLLSRVEDLILEKHRPWSAATVRLAARQRLWPIVVSALLIAAGLAPLAIQAGQPGHEILGPMVFVILGGLLTSTLVGLFVSPSLVTHFWRPRAVPE
ncbi:MAG TPA: efflux RND transporter permease subunit [Caulobacteraceae bacterium]